MKTLVGHISPETAYVVEDYPYGFRLRCKIHYWIEFKRGYGFRFCSQTTNPKVAGEHWNKPKCGTYHVVAVMVVNDDPHSNEFGYVSYQTLSSGGWSKEPEIVAFEQEHAIAIGENERKAIQYIRATNYANDHIKYSFGSESDDPNHVPQTREEQAAIYNAVLRQGYAEQAAGNEKTNEG